LLGIAAGSSRRPATGCWAEFTSVVDAVRCAVEIQSSMAQHNAGLAGDRRFDFRIGINVGDIIERDGDIFGDGVNIAYRLPGKILGEISDQLVEMPADFTERSRIGIDEQIADLAVEHLAIEEAGNGSRALFRSWVAPNKCRGWGAVW
jgi:class 3 adenylate cyclase